MKNSIYSLITTGILTQNIVLFKFLGLCPIIGASQKVKSAVGLFFATLVVILLASIMAYFINVYFLLPFNITILRIIIYIVCVAVLVQILELILKNFLPLFYNMFGIYLPLITTNCAVLGTLLLSAQQQYSLVQLIVYVLSTSIGFGMVLIIFSSIRQRIFYANVPRCFAGLPIAFITLGIMSLIFTGFTGINF